MATIIVTVTNIVLGRSDQMKVFQYSGHSEQVNSAAKQIRDRNKWEKRDCTVSTKIAED